MNAHARVVTDERGVVLNLEPSFTDLLGWAPEQMTGRRIGELTHPDDLKHCLRSWVHLRQAPRSDAPVRVRCQHLDGHWIWLDVTYHNLLASRGEILVDMVDVHREVELLELLASREQLLARLSEVTSVGVFHADLTGRVLYANPTLEELTGVSAATSLGEQLSAVAERERPAFAAAIQLAGEGQTTTVEVKTVLGHWRVRLWPVLASTGAVAGVGGSIEDRADGEAAPGPAYDPLTGALTLEATVGALGELVKYQAPVGSGATTGEARRHEARGTACVVVALGTLEELATRHGRDAREEVLSLVGLRIRDSVRSSDLLGRTGEDEFAVLCVRVPSTTAALSISHAILAQVTQPMTLSTGLAVTVRPGIGVDWVDDATSQPEHVLARSRSAALESATSEPSEPVLAAPPDSAHGWFGATAAASDESWIDELFPTSDEGMSAGADMRLTFDQVLPASGSNGA